MKGELYRRWLIEGAGATLSEFVASERARLRQNRAQRRWAQHYGPLMQQMTGAGGIAQMGAAQMQGAPPGMYRGSALGGIGGLFGFLGRG